MANKVSRAALRTDITIPTVATKDGSLRTRRWASRSIVQAAYAVGHVSASTPASVDPPRSNPSPSVAGAAEATLLLRL